MVDDSAPPAAFFPRKPIEPILATEWNGMPVQGRKELHDYTHVGGAENGPRLTGEAIDPATSLTIKNAKLSGTLAAMSARITATPPPDQPAAGKSDQAQQAPDGATDGTSSTHVSFSSVAQLCDPDHAIAQGVEVLTGCSVQALHMVVRCGGGPAAMELALHPDAADLPALAALPGTAKRLALPVEGADPQDWVRVPLVRAVELPNGPVCVVCRMMAGEAVVSDRTGSCTGLLAQVANGLWRDAAGSDGELAVRLV